jgi:ABC-type proline/glycine betaine transport system ATPase subunit
MREACALGDRVGVLDEGRLVAIDTPAGLRAHPSPVVALLMAS